MSVEPQVGPSGSQPSRQGYCGYCRVLYTNLDQVQRPERNLSSPVIMTSHDFPSSPLSAPGQSKTPGLRSHFLSRLGPSFHSHYRQDQTNTDGALPAWCTTAPSTPLPGQQVVKMNIPDTGLSWQPVSKDWVINVVVINDWACTVCVFLSLSGQVTLISQMSPLLSCQRGDSIKCISLMTITYWVHVSTRLTTFPISPINLSIRWEVPNQLQQRGFTTGCLNRLEKENRGHMHYLQRRHPFTPIKPGPRPTGRLTGRQTGGNAAMMTRLPWWVQIMMIPLMRRSFSSTYPPPWKHKVMTVTQLCRWARVRHCGRTAPLALSDVACVPPGGCADTCPGETNQGPACQPSHGSSGGPWGPDVHTTAWHCPPESTDCRRWGQTRGWVLGTTNRRSPASPTAYSRIFQGEDMGPDWTGGWRKGGETGPTVQKREIHLLLWQRISSQVQKYQ